MPARPLPKAKHMTLRVHQLFSVDGGFSNENPDPRANIYFVAASTVKAAYDFAHDETWAFGPEHPAGILEVQIRRGRFAGECWAWCGCPLRSGMGVRHGDGLRALTAAMREHVESTHKPHASPDLGNRCPGTHSGLPDVDSAARSGGRTIRGSLA